MRHLALHSALDARLETKKKPYLTRDTSLWSRWIVSRPWWRFRQLALFFLCEQVLSTCQEKKTKVHCLGFLALLVGASPSCWLLVFLSLAAVFGALVLYCGFGIGRFKLRSTQVLHLLSLAGQPSLFWSPPVRAEPHRWVFFPVFSFFFIMP